MSWWRGTDGDGACKLTKGGEVSQFTVIPAVLPNDEGSRAIDLPGEDCCSFWSPQFSVVRAEIRPPVLLLLAAASALGESLDVVMQ